MSFPRSPNAFANSPLDRAGDRRRDTAWLDAAWESEAARLAVFAERRPLLSEQQDGALAPAWLAGGARGRVAPPDAPWLFLGVDAGGAPYFALEAPDPRPLDGLGGFHDLRAAAPRLAWDDLAILGCAKSVFEWHARNRYCANCGGPSLRAEAGWRRDCPACSAEHYPRVDPVAIMLPTYGDQCLLARQARWPRGMMSALAGYMEPGETIEEAVARETLEEAGLTVTNVRLHSTQPWPFPGSLMLGAICGVAGADIVVDPHELESARWFPRAEARLLIAGKHPEYFCPPPFAIAHQLLKSWAEEGE